MAGLALVRHSPDPGPGHLLPRRKPPEQLTIADVVSATGIPVELWVADCFGISLAITDRGLVDGRPTSGVYTGPTDPRSPLVPPAEADSPPSSAWALWTVLGVTHAGPQQWGNVQGFVALSDGRVLDATRWTYELVPPYVYVGPATDYRETTDPGVLLYLEHLRLELESGERQPYDGSLSMCQHDPPERRMAQLDLRKALADSWFRPLFDLAASA